MAAADTTAVNGALSVIIRDIQKQYNHSAVTLGLLRKQANDTGKQVSWDISTGTTLGAYIAEGASQSTFQTYTKSLATLQTAEYSEGVHITEKALNAAAQSGPAALENLLTWELSEAVTRLTKKISQEVISGNTANAIVGMLAAGATTGAIGSTGTYAGVDRSVVTQHAGNVRTNPAGAGTLRSNSRAEMRQAWRLAYTASGMTPNLILCGPVQHLNYGGLADQSRELRQDVMGPVGKMAIDLGYNVLSFNGIPVVADPDFDTLTGMGTKMLMLNTNFIEVVQQPFSSTVLTHPDTVAVIPLMAGDEVLNGTGGSVGLTARLKRLPADGGFFKWQLLTELQLRQRRSNAHVVLADLDNT